MRKYSFFFFLCLFSKNGITQEADKVIASVNYTFMHQRDTLLQSYYTEEMSLMFGRQSSVYVSRTKIITDSIVRVKIEQQLRDGLPVKLGSINNHTKQNYYHLFSKQLAVIESPFLSNVYIFNDTIPIIDWAISEDTKMIGEFKCQKAIGVLAGRKYEAWFSLDLAISAGPWKLSGLPGLILEATDSKQQVKFLFASLIKSENVNTYISLPMAAIKTTKTEFKKMIAAYSENPGAFANNSGLDIKIDRKSGSSNKNVFNNPLEISDK